MNFVEAVKTCFIKYATFSGRAPRSEFWWFFLFNVIAGSALQMIYEPLNWIFSLATFLPYFAVYARRLHDINRSGWWIFLPAAGAPFAILGGWLGMMPLVAVGGVIAFGLMILIIVWFCKKGDDGENRFGPPPLPPVEVAAQTA